MLGLSRGVKFVCFAWFAALNLRWICISSILCGSWGTEWCSCHSSFSQYCNSRFLSVLWAQLEIVCSLPVPGFVYFECVSFQNFLCISGMIIFYTFSVSVYHTVCSVSSFCFKCSELHSKLVQCFSHNSSATQCLLNFLTKISANARTKRLTNWRLCIAPVNIKGKVAMVITLNNKKKIIS